MNKPNPTISLDELKQLVHSNRDELDQTIEEAISYLDTLHHTSHILFHIVHAFLLYVTDKEIREDLEHILEGYDMVTQSAGIPLHTYMNLDEDKTNL